MEFFQNEQIRSLEDKAWVEEVLSELQRLEDSIVNNGPIVIENRYGTKSIVESADPSNWEMVVSRCADSDPRVVEGHLQHMKGFEISEDRVSELAERLVDKLQKDRNRLVALLMLEVGKPIIEADADVAEAIDFVRYYAHLRGELGEKILFKDSKEECRLLYEPRGLAAVISPWNFPVAIPVGMIVSNLFVGNPVVFKPAEQSQLIGYEIVKLFWDVGFDETQLFFAPGLGETVGAALVRSPHVDVIMFTGSRAVGENILKATGGFATKNGFKRVIAEMGGKNAIYVDEDVDLNLAADIVLKSAFGYAGQKCSACSRLFVHKSIFNDFLELLSEKVETLPVGSAKDLNVFLPFVIEEGAYRRLSQVIKEADKAGIVKARSVYPEVKNAGLVPATLLLEPPKSSIFAREEFFGPILSVFKAEDFDQAIADINSVDYALTGGVITNSPEVIRRAIREFNCGNLYVNRKITGALVGRHPFGGRKFSGVGFKAGGENYLKQLVLEKVVSVVN